VSTSASSASSRGNAYALHVLVSRLDRNADRILRVELGLSYPRFLLLLTLGRVGAVTQRALADELGLTEPTVSRTVTALASDGLVDVTSVAGTGNRRRVSLTTEGRNVVDKSADRLEAAFDELLVAARVTPADLAMITDRLLRTLDGEQP
jgi:DNA-binding MarR family transcriptional regulator